VIRRGAICRADLGEPAGTVPDALIREINVGLRRVLGL
jgi:mRNA-degrading endonuclease toxin of MazEF toxin-antitoxin module